MRAKSPKTFQLQASSKKFQLLKARKDKSDATLIRTRLICTGKLTRSRSLMSPCCKAVKDDSRKHTVNLFLLLLPRRMPNEL